MQQTVPFQARPLEAIVIPQSYVFTFCKALHIQFDHPIKSQMSSKFRRNYFVLDEKRVLDKVFDTYEYPCRANLRLPKEIMDYATETKPTSLGSHFNADVMEESKQRILVLRENLTSMTATMFITDQSTPSLRNALILLSLRLRLTKHITIRTDSYSSFLSLVNDPTLNKAGITLDRVILKMQIKMLWQKKL